MALKNKQFLYFIFVGFILSVFQLTFAQGVPQKGMLWVYWGKSLDGNARNQRTLYFDFIPEDTKISNQNRIFLNLSKSQQAAVLKELVLPPNFYVYQEDSVKQPAQITMGKVGTEVICDGKYYSAKLIKFEKIPKTTAKQIPDSGCIYSLIMNNDFIVKSTDSHKVNLRSQPDAHADIIKRLDDNAIVEKLKTVRKDWYLVQLKDTATQGYVHKSQLERVE